MQISTPTQWSGFQIESDPHPAAPRRLWLEDSGGWARISIELMEDAPEPAVLGKDLSPNECRALAAALLSAANAMEQQYPELKVLN